MSNTLPWRTLATPATPSDFNAPSIALPCGSRMPVLSVTLTRPFIALPVGQWIAANGGGRNPGGAEAALISREGRAKPPQSRALHLEFATVEPPGRKIR